MCFARFTRTKHHESKLCLKHDISPSGLLHVETLLIGLGDEYDCSGRRDLFLEDSGSRQTEWNAILTNLLCAVERYFSCQTGRKSGCSRMSSDDRSNY